MTTQSIITIALAMTTAILIPSLVAEVRWRSKLLARIQKIESLLEFLQTYLLKNAVLEFHSPKPEHKASDNAIERLVEGEELSADEIDTLARRIQAVAKNSEDKKRRLKAATTLVLMDEFMEAVTGKKYTAFSEYD